MGENYYPFQQKGKTTYDLAGQDICGRLAADALEFYYNYGFSI
jgi:hypothetical protein